MIDIVQHSTGNATIAVRSDDGAPAPSRNDWYKDAIIYQLHVKAFQDSSGDGIGDFAGLMRRLDYVQELGVSAIWLLPFYPSPLRDDGYDISDYRSINPAYGSMKQFKAFVAEAHRRDLRVITELVINHTSDQHPWFQKARSAKPGSAARNRYVWSDTDEKFAGTRIIFLDTEKSNWTWDPVANAFYWHRFYSHQPDLNFDNPTVLREVLKIMRMWLDIGVDGLRLDAIPYLIEREGTNNENLPETHDVLKTIRAELDEHFSDRMLLAEANQWPEDVRPYFGEGDECHMGFHFPLMPRMYMALALADRHPITDIIRQTPDIPESCQWGIFLRNHDELTLEMVTDAERDYLWRTYAEDPRARINLGIRRRLAPLMKNDRRKIELLNSLLFSMPGTPIIYYGDEIGMGDNYYLGDRDGVRTPMHWSGDRNAGFSSAKPQQLYLPVILDPVYGNQTVNVESQAEDPSSLLNWMRRMILVRKQHCAFGRGTMTLLYPANRKILAYVREYDDASFVCVANLADSAQAVELDLSQFSGKVPLELTGRSAFPPVGDLPYMLTLGAYGFFWFLMSDHQHSPPWHQALPDILPEFITLPAPDGRIETALTGGERDHLEKEVLPVFLPLQRWFGAKDSEVREATLVPLGELNAGYHSLVALDVTLEHDRQQYFLPISARWGDENLRPGAPKLSYTIAKIRRGRTVGALIDGAHDESFAEAVLEAMRSSRTLRTKNGTVTFEGTETLAEMQNPGRPRKLGVDQSNVSIAFSDKVILKVYRRIRSGKQPDVEIARFLTETAGFKHTPRFLGTVDYHPSDGNGQATTLAAAFAFLSNQGDAWTGIVEALVRELNETVWGSTRVTDDARGNTGFPLDISALLGERTAEMHNAFAMPTDDPDFTVEPLTAQTLEQWADSGVNEARSVFTRLEKSRATLPARVCETVDAVLSRREEIFDSISSISGMTPSGGLSRIHGDYHLGQVLLVGTDVYIIDFEGEPLRSLEERRARSSPLRDVAGMLRSFDYAAAIALGRHAQTEPAGERARARAVAWRSDASQEFLSAYHSHIRGGTTVPADPALTETLLRYFLLQKAVYETGYELGNRPDSLGIPLRGVLELMEATPV